MPPAGNQAFVTQQTTCNRTIQARLPKFELKKFYGSVGKLQSFWDAFRNAVHKNTQLSEIDKFTYWKGLLGGEASTAIAGFSLTQGEYGAAIEISKKCFGVEQRIIRAHIEMLLKLTPVYNEKDTAKLEVRIRGLQSMGIQADTYGTLLVPVLLSKLPDDVKLEISRGVEDSKWNLDDLLKKFIARSRLERGTRPRPLILPLRSVLRILTNLKRVHSLHLTGKRVGVPFGWGSTGMLIVGK